MLVLCQNCLIKWVRITPMDNPGGTISHEDIQTICPNCHSNYWTAVVNPKEQHA